jgi:hypothetical protein
MTVSGVIRAPAAAAGNAHVPEAERARLTQFSPHVRLGVGSVVALFFLPRKSLATPVSLSSPLAAGHHDEGIQSCSMLYTYHLHDRA